MRRSAFRPCRTKQAVRIRYFGAMDMAALYDRFLAAQGKVSTDSRHIVPGSVFFALRGPAFDGNRFALEALNRGAACAVVDDASLPADSRLIRTGDVLHTLQELATFHRRRLAGTHVLALTGSNGKTTTKELIRAVLSRKGPAEATRGNLNNHIGVPLTLLSVRPGCAFAVVEMGANHVHEIEALCRIAEPDSGLITNIGKAHLEGFGGLEGVKRGKGELYDWLRAGNGTVFLNTGNATLRAMLGDYAHAVTYGSERDCFVSGSGVAEGRFVKLTWRKGGGPDHTVHTRLTGLYNTENLLAAACVGCHFGVTEGAIDAALSEYEPSNQRSQVAVMGTNLLVLDHYNANPASMEAALANFVATDPGPDYPERMVVLGDMLELGDDAPREHQAVADRAGASGAICIFVGNAFGACSLPSGAQSFETADEAADFLRKNNPSGCFMLVKGSRGMKLEKVVEALSS